MYIKTEKKTEKNIIYSAQWILFTTNWLKIYMSDFFSIAKNVKKLKRKSFKKNYRCISINSWWLKMGSGMVHQYIYVISSPLSIMSVNKNGLSALYMNADPVLSSLFLSIAFTWLSSSTWTGSWRTYKTKLILLQVRK